MPAQPPALLLSCAGSAERGTLPAGCRMRGCLLSLGARRSSSAGLLCASRCRGPGVGVGVAAARAAERHATGYAHRVGREVFATVPEFAIMLALSSRYVCIYARTMLAGGWVPGGPHKRTALLPTAPHVPRAHVRTPDTSGWPASALLPKVCQVSVCDLL